MTHTRARCAATLACLVLWPACKEDGARVTGTADVAADQTSVDTAFAAPDNPVAQADASAGEATADTSPLDSAQVLSPTCAELSTGAACDDGNPCTADTACAGAQCTGGVNYCQCASDADCAAVDDGNLCNGKLVCNKAVFPFRCDVAAATAVVCAKAAAFGCAQEACDPATGQCTVVADGTPCDDGLPCSAESFCASGTCKPGKATWCQCSADADCAAFEDGNPCNGSLYCDKATFPYQCKVNPATVVACDAAADTACSKNVCAPKTGSCAAVPVEQAQWQCTDKGCAWQLASVVDPLASPAPCSDGVACTTGDHCEAGQCKPGTDTCSCASNADCAAQEDGNFCNGTLFCNKGKKPAVCELNPATVVACANANDTLCAKNACNTLTGKCDCGPTAGAGCGLSAVETLVKVCTGDKCRWETLPYGATPTSPPACDDGNGCTAGEICGNGSCGGGVDTCICSTDADCKAQDDGNLCNGLLFCNKAKKKCEVNPATVVVCPSVLDTACTKNTCQPLTGACAMAPAPSTTLCEDGDPCTVGELCDGGACKGGTNTCSCLNDAQCAAWDDGDLCNGTMFCNKAKTPAICEVNPATKVNCATVDDTACLKYLCQPKTGKCQFTPEADFSACDDNNACTKNDNCLFGKCQPGLYTCECATNADCAGKDDGNLCNGTWYCDKTAAPKCLFNPASVVYCSKADDGPCQAAKCDPKTGACGLAPLPDGHTCTDGSPCTDNDACKGGLCAGSAVNCDDANPCTVDGCDAGGCSHKPANCQDGNPCTADDCNPKNGQCSFPVLPDGKACDADGNGCTVNDACKAGQCAVGLSVVCKLALDACQVAVCQNAGVNAFACVALPAPDGSACLGSSPCALGHTCVAGGCKPLPTDKLYVKELGSFGDGLALTALAAHDGGAAVGGVRSKGPEGQPSAATIVIAALGGDASPTWVVETASAGAADPAIGVAAVRPLPGGDWAAIATRRWTASGDLDLWVVRLTANGQSFVADTQVATAGDDIAWGAAHGAQVGWWVAGQTGSGSGARAALWRVTEGGSVLAQWKSPSAVADALRGVVVQSDGGALAVGVRSEAAGERALLVRVGPQGGLLWQKTLQASAPESLAAAVATPSGLLAAGTRTAAGTGLPMVLRLDGAGAVLSSWVGTAAADPRSVAALPGSRAVLAGSAAGPAWAQGLTALLEPLWAVAHQPTAPATWRAVAVGPDGGLWLAGARAGPVKALVGRSDPWGHLSCPAAGTCAALTADACDDKEPCTFDLCEPGNGCVHAPTSSPCNDGNACTTDDQCKAGTCAPGGPTNCDDGNVCTADACDAKAGCGHVGTVGGCDDGNPCTELDGCIGALCKGAAAACDDGSVCTKDSCDLKVGCVHTADAKLCDDGNVCTDDSCDKAKGCTKVNNSKACDVGDRCLEGDVCAVGVCKAGTLATLYASKTPYNDATVQEFVLHDDGSATFVGSNMNGVAATAGKLAPGGEFTLVKSWAGGPPSTLYAVVRLDNDAVSAGYTMANTAGAEDGWLRRTSAAGVEQWSYTYGGTAYDALFGVVGLGADIVAVGQTASEGAGGGDGWILRVNGSGVVISSKTLGGAKADSLGSAVLLSDGGLLVAGSTQSSGVGKADAWLLRLDAQLNAVWQHTYGTAGDDGVRAMTLLANGNIAIAGARGGSANSWAILDPQGRALRYGSAAHEIFDIQGLGDGSEQSPPSFSRARRQRSVQANPCPWLARIGRALVDVVAVLCDARTAAGLAHAADHARRAGVTGRAVADGRVFARPVVAPRRRAWVAIVGAVGGHLAGITAKGRRIAAQHPRRPGGLGLQSGPEAAVQPHAPAEDRAVAPYCTRVAVAGADGDGPAEPLDRDRHRGAAGTLVAQCACSVVAPTPRGPCGVERTGVDGADRQLRRWRQLHHVHGGNAERGLAVAQLALAAVAPTLDRAVASQRAR
ncbi:MAG: hypothetical protein FJ100_01880 [Deltaproteobacteria bacterium]|nr:hypothetical protein [Deltaproteobacteria bacterium]